MEEVDLDSGPPGEGDFQIDLDVLVPDTDEYDFTLDENFETFPDDQIHNAEQQQEETVDEIGYEDEANDEAPSVVAGADHSEPVPSTSHDDDEIENDEIGYDDEELGAAGNDQNDAPQELDAAGDEINFEPQPADDDVNLVSQKSQSLEPSGNADEELEETILQPAELDTITNMGELAGLANEPEEAAEEEYEDGFMSKVKDQTEDDGIGDQADHATGGSNENYDIPETQDESASDLSFDIPDVAVIYNRARYSLFGTSQDDPAAFFLSDVNELDRPVSELLASIREVIVDDISDKDELCIRIDRLSCLEFGEHSDQTFLNRSFREILDCYRTLLVNDGLDQDTLVIRLVVRQDSEEVFNDLIAGAAAGKGLSDLLDMSEADESPMEAVISQMDDDSQMEDEDNFELHEELEITEHREDGFDGDDHDEAEFEVELEILEDSANHEEQDEDQQSYEVVEYEADEYEEHEGGLTLTNDQRHGLETANAENENSHLDAQSIQGEEVDYAEEGSLSNKALPDQTENFDLERPSEAHPDTVADEEEIGISTGVEDAQVSHSNGNSFSIFFSSTTDQDSIPAPVGSERNNSVPARSSSEIKDLRASSGIMPYEDDLIDYSDDEPTQPGVPSRKEGNDIIGCPGNEVGAIAPSASWENDDDLIDYSDDDLFVSSRQPVDPQCYPTGDKTSVGALHQSQPLGDVHPAPLDPLGSTGPATQLQVVAQGSPEQAGDGVRESLDDDDDGDPPGYLSRSLSELSLSESRPVSTCPCLSLSSTSSSTPSQLLFPSITHGSPLTDSSLTLSMDNHADMLGRQDNLDFALNTNADLETAGEVAAVDDIDGELGPILDASDYLTNDAGTLIIDSMTTTVPRTDEFPDQFTGGATDYATTGQDVTSNQTSSTSTINGDEIDYDDDEQNDLDEAAALIGATPTPGIVADGTSDEIGWENDEHEDHGAKPSDIQSTPRSAAGKRSRETDNLEALVDESGMSYFALVPKSSILDADNDETDNKRRRT